MKYLIHTLLLTCGLTFVLNQGANAQQDTVKKKTKYTIDIDGDKLITKRVDSTKSTNKGYFIGGLTFTRVDLGFARLIDNGNFNLSPTNQFLDYKGGKTSTFSFDIIQYGYRFNTNFKISLAGGFDWTLIRLRNNITIQKNQSTLTYINEPIAFSKNRFSSSYVHFPLHFELRTKENNQGKRYYLVFAPEIGFLLNGKVKQKSDERGKDKQYDSYHFQSIRYGGAVRFGYGGLGIFTKYYFNDMFNTPAQAGLKNMNFGITFGIN